MKWVWVPVAFVLGIAIGFALGMNYQPDTFYERCLKAFSSRRDVSRVCIRFEAKRGGNQ